jgi:hypothetical protein
MRIALASEHAGFLLKETLREILSSGEGRSRRSIWRRFTRRRATTRTSPHSVENASSRSARAGAGYAKAGSTSFEELVAELCATEEWKYAERVIGIRMVREDG